MTNNPIVDVERTNHEGRRIAPFGNHDDPSTDFCMEVYRLEGWALDINARVRSQWPFWWRLSKILGYIRMGHADTLDDIAQKARAVVPTLERRVTHGEFP